MATASLLVKIAADFNSFSRDLNRMTRDVDRAARKLAGIGKDLTIGLTVPLGLAGAALAKMAIGNDQMAGRMRASFGPAVGAMNAQLRELSKVAPASMRDLQTMAVSVQNFGRGVGLAAPQAEALAAALIQMAGDVGAFAGVSTSSALTALISGLEGETAQLRPLGIEISKAQIKQEAYRQGLLGANEALTPLGTALATYSLLLKQSSQFQGEAARQANSTSVQWARLVAETEDLAADLSELLLPPLRTIIGVVRAVVGAVRELPDWFKGTALAVGAIAAAIGPTLTLSVKLTAAWEKLRVAVQLLVAGEALPKLVTLMTALMTDPKILIAMTAIAGAVALATVAWKRFNTAVENTPKPGPAIAFPSLKDLLGGGATSASTLDPLAALQKSANLAVQAYTRAVTVGDRANDSFARLVDIGHQAYEVWAHAADPFSEIAQAALEIYDRMNAIKALKLATDIGVMGAFAGGGAFQHAVVRASRVRASDDQVNQMAAGQAIDAETALRVREAAMRLPDAFDAARNAAVTLAESYRDTADRFHQAVATTRTQFGSLGGLKNAAVSGLQAGFVSLTASLGPVALIAEAIGKVLEGLQPVIDAVMTPLIALGRIIGQILIPVLHPLFEALKIFGIAVALSAEVTYTIFSGIARFVGNIVKAVGNVIKHIPFLGGVGRSIARGGDALLKTADGFSQTAKDLDRSRIELQHMSFASAMAGTSLAHTADAANALTESLLNVPTGFKIALERFIATQPVRGPQYPLGSDAGSGGAGAGGGSPAPGGGSSTTVQASAPVYHLTITGDQLDARTIAQRVLAGLRQMSQEQYGSTTRWTELA